MNIDQVKQQYEASLRDALRKRHISGFDISMRDNGGNIGGIIKLANGNEVILPKVISEDEINYWVTHAMSNVVKLSYGTS